MRVRERLVGFDTELRRRLFLDLDSRVLVRREAPVAVVHKLYTQDALVKRCKKGEDIT